MRQRRCPTRNSYHFPQWSYHPQPEGLHSPLLLYLLRDTWLVSLNSLSHRLFLSRVSCRHGVCAFTQFFRVTTVIGKVKLLFTRIFKQTCFQPPWHLLFQRVLLFPILETSWRCLVGNSATVTPKLFRSQLQFQLFSFWSVNYHLSTYFSCSKLWLLFLFFCSTFFLVALSLEFL